ncbi:MAG: hypothetical protein IJO91_09875 [Oscillospiraceae bacterium]|nr:hypothetical protein [Oscillospiraceae bacterium]
MELKHYQCPSCGAGLDVDSSSAEIKCDYCGQHFIVDLPNSKTSEDINETITDIINERMDEINPQPQKSKFEKALILGVAATVAIIALAMIILAFTSPDVLANT